MSKLSNISEGKDVIDLGGGFGLFRHGLSDKTGEFQNFRILQNDQIIGSINFGVVGDVGEIGDVYLNDEAKGQGLMRLVFPVLRNVMRRQGAVRIKLITVDDLVGRKVWGPLGFVYVSNIGPNKVWSVDI